MADNERRCMVCGEVLGAEEQYCGKCGTKAPDGAVEKEEIGIKYNVKQTNENVGSHISLKLHNFICDFAGIHSVSVYGILWNVYYIYMIDAFRRALVDNGLIQNYKIISIIFGLIFLGVSIFSVITHYKLFNLKKHAPQYLWILCVVRIVIWPVYVFLLWLVDAEFGGWDVLAVYESLLGIFLLITSYIYYKKKMKAFIN